MQTLNLRYLQTFCNDKLNYLIAYVLIYTLKREIAFYEH